MAVFVTHIDDDPLCTGAHEGSNGESSLFVKDFDFRMYGVSSGLVIYNTTQGSNGLITSVENQRVFDDTNSWDAGDGFEIYKTAEKNSIISRIATDRSRGWKVTSPDELDKSGWFPEDHDIDKDEDGYYVPPNKRPFGPNQPDRSHK